MKKAALLFLIFASVIQISFSQEMPVMKYFVDSYEKPIDQKKAIYMVAVYKLKADDLLWQRDMYYARYNQTIIRSKGQCKDSIGLIKQGPYITYHENGKKLMQESFEDGKKNGEQLVWYNSGKLYKDFHFENGIMTGSNIAWYENGSTYDSFMLDKTGKGHGTGYYDDGSLRYEGNFENGTKNGEWTYYFQGGGNKKSTVIFFNNDDVVTINCFDAEGASRKEDCIHEREAEYTGGVSAWIQYLSESLQNVKSEKYLSAGSKHTVIIKFIVDKNGDVKDAVVENPEIQKLEKIALKIIANSPKWIPAIQYGQRVNAYRRQPVTFAVD